MNYNEARRSIANKLSIPDKLLSYLFHQGIDNFYKLEEIEKKSGGIRKIRAPQGQLKSVLKVILKFLKVVYEDKELTTKFSHGFEKGKSIITNAELHKGKRYVLNIDLENFFDSFHFGRVRGFFFKNLDMSLEEATVLANLVCYNRVLPQGAPTSPIITNMICRFMDLKMIKVAKKYKCTYTRYADDLTFSSSNRNFEEHIQEIVENVEKIVNKAGFNINHNKTHLQYNNSSQKVTGLVVNKIVNIDNKYYKNTRAMAENLYKYGDFYINGEPGKIKQLEGRFAFIDQLNFENNKKSLRKKDTSNFNRREKSYQEFLFYKYFYANDKPLILTEGKTDITYLKAALKKMYNDYPELIEKSSDGFRFKIQFLERSRRLNYFLNYIEGASGLKNIYALYFWNPYNFYSKFELKRRVEKQKPVFLLFDNEINNKEKPLRSFLNSTNLNCDGNRRKILNDNCLHIDKNLYLVTNQLLNGEPEMEIEDLFKKEVLEVKIKGKVFDKRDGVDREETFGKARFAEYVYKNYQEIDFNNFKPMLQNISDIIKKTEK